MKPNTGEYYKYNYSGHLLGMQAYTEFFERELRECETVIEYIRCNWPPVYFMCGWMLQERLQTLKQRYEGQLTWYEKLKQEGENESK